MSFHSLTGALEVKPDDIAEGWAFAPDRPAQRLVVEVVVNGACVGAIAAAEFRRDLLLQGMGDGHHGWHLSLPAGAIPDFGPIEISAREQASQQVFARIVREGPALAPRHREALDREAQVLQELWAELEVLYAGRARKGRAEQLRAAFRHLSALLTARARVRDEAVALDAAVALDRLQHFARPASVPLIGRPAVSVIMPAGQDAPTALGRIASLAPALTEAEVEIVLIDDGADPATALLPALSPNLVYLRANGPGPIASGWAEAAGIARGAVIAVLDAVPREPSATALLALARCTAAAPRTVVLGRTALAACERVNAPGAPRAECPAPAPLGLRIALARDLLVRAGGFEPAMADGAALESAELWLRCRLLGADALAWREPGREGGGAGPHREWPRAALNALAAFRQRWPASTQ